MAGRSLIEPGSPAMGAIVVAGPHRVFMARFGRREVYQPIPPADGRSPEGPHTHVLPQLLKNKCTHAATEPVLEVYVPCAHLVPAHPVRDAMGYARPFDQNAHARFEALPGRFGSPQLHAVKAAVRRAVAEGADPAAFGVSATKFERHALRLAPRPVAASETPNLSKWLALYDRRDSDLAEEPCAH